MRLWEELRRHLEALKVLERDLKRRPDQDLHERTRPDMVAVAIEHLEQRWGRCSWEASLAHLDTEGGMRTPTVPSDATRARFEAIRRTLAPGSSAAGD